ncbi:MAG: hypothetical protein R8K53_05035 [Mariprofundaceae bacterium]
MANMLRTTLTGFFILSVLMLSGCGESVQTEKVAAPAQKAYPHNPTDTVGVAEGDQQVSPFGKPAN